MLPLVRAFVHGWGGRQGSTSVGDGLHKAAQEPSVCKLLMGRNIGKNLFQAI